MKSTTADNLRGLARDAKQCSPTERLLTQRLLTRRLLIYVHDLGSGLNWVSYWPGQAEQDLQQELAQADHSAHRARRF